MNILVAGLGKLGSVMAALLADAGHNVIGVDPNKATCDAINRRIAPVDEPGLPELLARLDRRLTALDTNWDTAVGGTDAAMVVVPTPSLPAGGFDAGLVDNVVSEIAIRLKGSDRPTPYLIVVCSTLSPGQMVGEVAPAVEAWSGLTIGEGVLLSYSPEFIALGTVIRDMVTPDMVLVGAQDNRSAQATVALSETFRSPCPAHRMSFTEAEITKLSINSYLSMKIGFANMIGATVDKLGGNPKVVLDAVGADERIGRSYLAKGGPPSGPCLPRDLVALEALGERLRLPMPFATAARDVTRHLIDDILRRATMMEGTSVRVAVLGVAYKPLSPVTDDSLARHLIARGSQRGARISTYDPYAELPPSFPFQHRRCETLTEALDGSDVVIIACPHPDFDSIDFGHRKVINPWQ